MQPGVWGTMQSLFLSDEELGKKDDDHKAGKGKIMKGSSWQPARVPPRKTFRRLGLVLLVAVAVYLFIKNIPTDLPQRDQYRRPVYNHADTSNGNEKTPSRPFPQEQGLATQPTGEERDPAPASSSNHVYAGPVRFLNLASSLHAIASTMGAFTNNKNILFAASNLKSAATLLPVACQMGTERRSYVHFALMSRSEIEIAELRKINGIDDSCNIIFHDARPEFSAISTASRLRTGVTRAMYHINMYMHPQAILVDSSRSEESFFLHAMLEHGAKENTPIIELPEHAPDRLAWLTKLDSSSMASWNKVSVDILIHAIPGASGGLIRLLKSLSTADFTSCAVPHLTIELPQDIDPPTERFLERFQWPPKHAYNPTSVRQLSLRRRIPRAGLSEEESSVRFLESFWPAHPKHSHVLVLSPQVELSSHFFHYLKYIILEYKYSAASAMQQWGQRLFSISLEAPSVYLNGTGPFAAPEKIKPETSQDAHSDSVSDTATPFLWQAPNSNAAVFMGEKWVELHGFVSRWTELQNTVQPAEQPLTHKEVSKKYPSWLEHALRLSRARGYMTLYPSLSTSASLAAVHNELYRVPEEYEKELPQDTSSDLEEVALTPANLLESLPDGGALAPLHDLPLLAWNGALADQPEINDESLAYAADFRRLVGGCAAPAAGDIIIPDKSAKDLFCMRNDV